jgi:dihydrolipoamide dehydrogenase
VKTFDMIVIGSGSGLEVSADAAASGLSVAVIEEGPFGGTCHNRGCIPSKMLIHSADVMETIRRAGEFGIQATVQGIDWPFIVRRVFEEIDAEADAIEQGNRQAPNVEVYKGRGRFVGPKTLEVNGEQIGAETVVIAAGTRPSIPDVPGLADVTYRTSDDVMRLPEQPGRLVVVGGGYIAAEMAHFFGSLGTEVTILYRGTSLLRTQDEDISRRFTEVYQRRFDVRLNTRLSGVASNGDAVDIDLTTDGGSETLTADVLLFATGRVPNTDVLEVANAGVEVDDRGFVVTNEYLETTTPGVWALGDIVGQYLLKHSASLEAAYAGYNIFNPDARVAVDYHAMPNAVFASPQVASVGLTERRAEDQGVPYHAATYDYYDTAYGASIEDRDGFVKALANAETGEILGCHVIGTDASVLVQEVANAMRMRQDVDAITQAIYVHPALPEVVQRAFGALQQHG